MTLFNVKSIIFVSLACSMASFALDESAFEAGNIWGWGGDASYEAQIFAEADSSKADTADSTQATDESVSRSANNDTGSSEATLPKNNNKTKDRHNTQVYIPFFDEYIGKLLLQKDFKTLANVDSIQYNIKRLTAVHKTIHSTYSFPTEGFENVVRDVYAYMSSSAWESDLQKLDADDASFVRLVVYTCFMSQPLTKRYIQILLDRITDDRKKEFIEDLYELKPTRTVLKASHWYMMIGAEGDFFSNGADEKISPGPAYALGFGYCLAGMYCGEFRIGGMFTSPYKEDVIQSGITYPKEHISYSAVEALLRVKLVYAFDYDISVFGGLRLHALEFDTEKDKEFKEDYGKGMANSYSFGYTAGISGAKFFAGNGTMPKLFGIGIRAGFANFGESKFDVTGFNWYAGIDFSIRLVSP